MVDNEDVKQWKVLIVDDDIDNLTVAAEYLKYLGATIRTAFDGEKGLEAVKEFDPTIILLDLSMPKMDGWEMFKRLREAEKAAATQGNAPIQGIGQIPVIALTAHALPADKDKVEAAGFNGYVTKPFVFTALLQLMREQIKPHEDISIPK